MLEHRRQIPAHPGKEACHPQLPALAFHQGLWPPPASLLQPHICIKQDTQLGPHVAAVLGDAIPSAQPVLFTAGTNLYAIS